MKYHLFSILMLVLMASCNQNKTEISLAGEWNILLDSLLDPGSADMSALSYHMTIQLPNTLDKAGIGDPLTLEPELSTKVMRNLHRKVAYVGPAYYTREISIPDNWEEKVVSLKMERIIWKSTVWIDGHLAGSCNSLSAPHTYDLTEYLGPGKHTLTICIDNRKQVNISKHDYAHAYTNETQTIWNGILGQFILSARDKNHVVKIDLFPRYDSGEVSGMVTLSEPMDGAGKLKFSLKDPDGNLTAYAEAEASGTEIGFSMEAGPEIVGWNEHHPELYKLEVTLLDDEESVLNSCEEKFGFRDIGSRDGHLVINGQKIFLRGTLECSIFPLTGHPPLQKQEWETLLLKARDFGLNHLRFHSWCPPKAAFEAADELGFYFQVELPNWSLSYGSDPKVVSFVEKEAERILSEYGNHPSFLLFCMGNELMGDFDLVNGLVNMLKEEDNRHLYTTTAFTFQEENWGFHEPSDDFYVTQWTDAGWIRGQGVFDEFPPNFNSNYDQAIHHVEIPVISHEIGQYTVFPKLDEIEKYTGVLRPLNFEAVQNDLEKKGRLEMAPRYTEATGKFATILYKEEIERAYKTAGLSGFQLLDLHDFPGQGTALVGMLDAFWDSKGFTTGEAFREFCSEVVPLLWFDKAVYTTADTFRADAGLSNYKGDLDRPELNWRVLNSDGISLANGVVSAETIPHGSVAKLGTIELPLDETDTPGMLTVELSLDGTHFRNSWQLWVYESVQEPDSRDVFVTASFEEAIEELQRGSKVLLTPSLDQVDGIAGKFVPVFWSPVHFPNQPGTMGTLCDPSHPVFSSFPTESHSNWQWWDISKYSKSVEIDHIDVEPLITVMDNFFKNRELTNLFEAKVGNGLLLFSSIDLVNNLDERIATRQLKASILDYMNSDHFHPGKILKPEDLLSFYEISEVEEEDVLSIYD